jgi:hypothetical protein
MGKMRERLPDMVPDQKDRKQIYRLVLAALLESEGKITDSEINRIVKTYISENNHIR